MQALTCLAPGTTSSAAPGPLSRLSWLVSKNQKRSQLHHFPRRCQRCNSHSLHYWAVFSMAKLRPSCCPKYTLINLHFLNSKIGHLRICGFTICLLSLFLFMAFIHFSVSSLVSSSCGPFTSHRWIPCVLHIMKTLLVCHWPFTLPMPCFTQNSLFSCSEAVNSQFALSYCLGVSFVRAKFKVLNYFIKWSWNIF